MAYHTLTPAYGRDYKSMKAAKADWEAGKDFVLEPSGQYINKSGAEQYLRNGDVLNVRYNSLKSIGKLDTVKKS